MEHRELKRYFMEFKAIQDIQIATFDIIHNGSNDKISYNQNIRSISSNSNISELDLDKMLFERNRAFENLRSAISLVSQSVLKRFKNDADDIIYKDTLFMKKLEEQKNEILKKINQSAKGKQLLKGYMIAPKKSLRFMNNKI
ncbi:MAG: hypothetical protein HQK72_07765 [Desulfamplus sp.]|nr:hypothetical protein [Desulfamplus sp.]